MRTKTPIKRSTHTTVNIVIVTTTARPLSGSITLPQPSGHWTQATWHAVCRRMIEMGDGHTDECPVFCGTDTGDQGLGHYSLGEIRRELK